MTSLNVGSSHKTNSTFTELSTTRILSKHGFLKVIWKLTPKISDYDINYRLPIICLTAQHVSPLTSGYILVECELGALTKLIYNGRVSGLVGKGQPRRTFHNHIDDVRQKGQVKSALVRRAYVKVCVSMRWKTYVRIVACVRLWSLPTPVEKCCKLSLISVKLLVKRLT